MSKQTEPAKDPNIGTWTPAWAKWAMETKTDVEFLALYKMTKADGRALYPKEFGVTESKPVAGKVEPIKSNESNKVKADATPEKSSGQSAPDAEGLSDPKPEAEALESVSSKQAETDLKEMHHKTFSSKYGMTKKEYKSKGGLI
jgi:hypothetical protein